jgi:hypothetical protein
MDCFTPRKRSDLHDYNSSIAGALLTSVGSIGDLCADTKMHRIFRSNHNNQQQSGQHSLFLLDKINESKNDGYILLNELHSDLNHNDSVMQKSTGSDYAAKDSIFQMITVN